MGANWIDRAIGYVAPAAGRRRMAHRLALEYLARGYDGASVGRRTAGWSAGGSSADTEIALSGARLRDRMRDLVRNNPHAAKAVSVWVTNIVGEGIRPRAKTGDPKLDKRINELFDAWSKVCDADGQLDFYGQQTLVARGMVEAGEGLVRLRRRQTSDGLPVALQLQVLEADYIDSNRTGAAEGRNFAVSGIEFNGIGQRTAYWLWNAHPGSTALPRGGSLQSYPVPAADVVHVYDKQRTQVRGVPWGAPVITSLRDLDDYEDAEMMRKKLESCVVGVVTGGDEDDLGIALPGQTADDPGVYDAHGNPVERMEPGMFLHARGGRDVKFNAPAVNGSYEAYRRTALLSIAAGFLLPYELLSGDLNNVSFISGRLGLTDFRRRVAQVQYQIMVPMFCDPVWNWFTQVAYGQGLVPSPVIPVEWTAPRFPSVDPHAEAQADLADVRAGFRSRSEVISERGYDPIVVLDEIAADAAALDARGLILDSDPRQQTAAGQARQTAAMNGGAQK